MAKKRRLTPEEKSANKDRANLKRRMRRLWRGDLTMSEICEEMAMPHEAVAAFAASLGLGPREEPDVYVPSPQEIRQAAARIRMSWSPAEREARLGGRRLG